MWPALASSWQYGNYMSPSWINCPVVDCLQGLFSCQINRPTKTLLYGLCSCRSDPEETLHVYCLQTRPDVHCQHGYTSVESSWNSRKPLLKDNRTHSSWTSIYMWMFSSLECLPMTYPGLKWYCAEINIVMLTWSHGIFLLCCIWHNQWIMSTLGVAVHSLTLNPLPFIV